MEQSALLTTTSTKELENLWKKVFHEGIKLEKPKGHILKESSGEEHRFYFLQKGQVSLISISAQGKEHLLGKTQGPALLCEENAFSQHDRGDSFILLNTPCTFYVFTQQWVQTKLLPCYPDLTLSILQSLSAKTLKLVKQRIFLHSESVSMLICKFLQLHIVLENKEVYARPLLTQVELASFLGIHHVSLNKALKAMQSEGILGKYHKEKTAINNYERFLSIVNQDSIL